MAQKLGLALIALFGFVNADFAYSNSGIVKIYGPAPVVTGSLSHHDDDDDGPTLGHSVILGSPDVKLGETEDHHDDDQPQYKVVNFVGPVTKERRDYSKNKGGDKDDDDSKPRYSSDKSDDSSASKGERYGSYSQFEYKGKSYHNDKSNQSGSDKNYKSDDRHENYQIGDKSDRASQIVVVSTVKTVNTDSKVSSQTNYHRKDDDDHDANDVLVPVFGKLKYVDNDPHGEAVKAPITIVTAPLVSTAQTEHHKVGFSNVVGKSNCPECKQQKKEAKQHDKSSNKALSKNVDLLTTEIKGPISNVVVKPEESDDEDDSQNCQNSAHHHGRKYDSHGAAIIDQRKLKKDLAEGEARENAPFVVGSVVIPSNQNLSTDDDDDHESSKRSGKRHN